MEGVDRNGGGTGHGHCDRHGSWRALSAGSRSPALEIDDLPEPEEVFDSPVLDTRRTVTRVLGPSLIALGLSIGSGEWLLGPLAIGTEGSIGIGFVIFLSILLQAFYNVEIGRYVIATGEVPALGFGRIPPGFFIGTFLAVALFYLAFITGGWAAAAGDGLFALFTGDVPGEGDRTESRLLALGLHARRLRDHALRAAGSRGRSSSSIW